MEEDDVPMEVEAAKEADEELSEEFQLLAAQAVTAPEQAMAGYLAIINGPLEKTPAGLKRHTFAIQQLGALYAKHGKAQELGNLIYTVRPFLEFVSKAKGGQLFKSLMDLFLDIPNVQQLQVEVCNNCLEWAKAEKRTFLRQSLEVRLLALYLEAKQYQNCLAQAATLLKELKRLDDKALLVDVHLLESKSFFALGNYPRSRASLVSARTTANAIYCPPRMQASLDLQSGVLHAQEGDFKTAYSYFYEAFEGFDSVDVKVQAILGLKYMLLGKIVNDEARDVQSICSGKLALRYAGRDLEAMKKVSEASIHRSLAEFEECLVNYKQELKQDPIIATHLTRLYDELLEKNLARVVEPFSKVEIDHVAKVIQRPREIVEAKLSQMILDKKLDGILDQGAGCLELFTVSESDRTYEAALGTIQQMGGVVDALFARAQKIF